MPKRQRISRADFSKIAAAKSQRLFGSLFSLSVSTTLDNSISEPKFACIASKKVAVHAVDRNLIKRRCREAVRKIKDLRGPLSLVFYAKKEAKGASYAQIEEDVRKLISQIK